MKQLCFFFAESLGSQRRWTEWGKARRWAHGHISWSRACAGVLNPPKGSDLEQGEHGVAEDPLGVTSLGQRAMLKARKGVCSTWHDALRGGAPAAAGASGHYGSCQIKSRNHHFHILFNVMIPQEDFAAMWGSKNQYIVGAQEDSLREVRVMHWHLCPAVFIPAGTEPLDHICAQVH